MTFATKIVVLPPGPVSSRWPALSPVSSLPAWRGVCVTVAAVVFDGAGHDFAGFHPPPPRTSPRSGLCSIFRRMVP